MNRCPLVAGSTSPRSRRTARARSNSILLSQLRSGRIAHDKNDTTDRSVIKVGRQLLTDFGNQLSGREKAAFIRALHALAWQESLWQHSIRYKNWFFVVLSGTSYNALDDWGITQVARSHGHPDELLNERF